MNKLYLKEVITQLIDSDNDGVRTHAIKFMEMVVLTQTHRGPSSAPKVDRKIVGRSYKRDV
jgi:symplekin